MFAATDVRERDTPARHRAPHANKAVIDTTRMSKVGPGRSPLSGSNVDSAASKGWMDVTRAQMQRRIRSYLDRRDELVSAGIVLKCIFVPDAAPDLVLFARVVPIGRPRQHIAPRCRGRFSMEQEIDGGSKPCPSQNRRRW